MAAHERALLLVASYRYQHRQQETSRGCCSHCRPVGKLQRLLLQKLRIAKNPPWPYQRRFGSGETRFVLRCKVGELRRSSKYGKQESPVLTLYTRERQHSRWLQSRDGSGLLQKTISSQRPETARPPPGYTLLPKME